MLCLTILVACGSESPSPSPSGSGTPSAAQSAPAVGGELRLAIASFGTESLDPQRSPNFNGFYLGPIFDPLVGLNAEGNDISQDTGIAQDWTVSEDGLTYTFTLREGVLFHNGDEVTAEDVKFTLDRLADEETRSTYGRVLAGLFESVTVTGPYEVEVRLVSPAATLLMMLSPLLDTSGLIVPKNYIEEVGVEEFGQAPVGSGPFSLVERQSGSFMRYERASDSHFAYGAVPYENLLISAVAEEATRQAQLEAGDADFIDLGIDRAAELGTSGFQIFESESMDSLTLTYQLQRPDDITNDINLRKALSYAVDRDTINEFLYGGQALVTGNVMMGQVGGEPIPADPYDPEAAAEFLADSEYDTENPLVLNIQSMNFVGWPQMLDTASALQDYWRDIGITTEITYRELGAFLAEWGPPGTLPDDVVIMNVLFGRPDFAGNTRALFTCEGVRVGVCDPTLDEMTADWLAASSEEEYSQQAATVEQYLVENYYATTILAKAKLFAANDNVSSDFMPGAMAGTFHIRSLISGGQ
jgi:peptide/nickel transport system substrate-binding protein